MITLKKSTIAYLSYVYGCSTVYVGDPFFMPLLFGIVLAFLFLKEDKEL